MSGVEASFSDSRIGDPYRAVLDVLDEGVVVMDRDMVIVHANPAAERILGVPVDRLIGTPTLEAFQAVLRPDGSLWPNEELPIFRMGPERAVRGATVGLRRLDGRRIWLAVGMRALGSSGYVCSFNDVTDVRNAEDALRRERRQLAAAQRIARIGSWSWDPRTGAVEWSEEMCRLHGVARPLDRGAISDYLAFVHPEDRIRMRTFMRSVADRPRHFETTYRMQPRNGEDVDVEVRAYAEPGGVLEGTVQDITERLRFERRLRHLADHDPLTGLLNRRGFESEMARHLSRVRRYGAEGGLLVLDLDRFKEVNDTFGHAAGDALIVDVAGALRSRVRESDVLARMGGDEFAVLLPRGGEDELGALAGDLLAGLGDLAPPGTREVPLSASIGGAPFAEDASAEEVLARADHAMYVAKDAGRNRYAAWDAQGAAQ